MTLDPHDFLLSRVSHFTAAILIIHLLQLFFTLHYFKQFRRAEKGCSTRYPFKELNLSDKIFQFFDDFYNSQEKEDQASMAKPDTAIQDAKSR
jgi:hypothetical protein